MIFRIYPHIELTASQAENIKRALKKGTWKSLRTYKEKFVYQCFTHNANDIKIIGLEAKNDLNKL